MNPSDPLVVEVVRSHLVESAHSVDAVVADGAGAVVARAGDPATVAYLRSSAKPVQATVCEEQGWVPPGAQQLAVACASHNGEPDHVEAVRSTLAAAGLTEDDLQCPADVAAVIGAMTPHAPGRIYHNCSGKHAAMLAATVASGGRPRDYLLAGSQIHREVQALAERLAGAKARALGVDGCGVPTFAFSLAEAATLYARLPEAAPRAIYAMRSHPFLVAGSHRICTAVMTRAPGIVLKVGAEGLICGALTDRGIGFALKARDGGVRGREPATLHVLEALGSIDPSVRERTLEEVLLRLLPAQGHKPDLLVRGELERV